MTGLITDGVFAAAARHPDKIAICCADMVVTYGALAARIEIIAARIDWLEMKRVGILLGNHPALIEMFLGTAHAGAVAMVMDPSWPSALQEQMIDRHAPDVVVRTPAATVFPAIAHKAALPKPDSPFFMGFTSGTTGAPKAFIRSHDSWVATFAAARAEFGAMAAGRVLAPGPLCHGLTLYAAVETLAAGGTVMLQPHFDAGAVFDVIARGEADSFICVPTMLDMVLAKADIVPHALDIVCAGAKLSPSLRARAARLLPAATVTEYYGASELSFVTVAQTAEACPPDSVGRAFDGVSVAVRRDDGTDAVTGEVGTVWVRSAMLSDGYVGPTDGTGFRLDQAVPPWATVEDRGSLDAQGFLTLAGRDNDMLISGGYNVYPHEIETVLLAVPGVTAAAVIGLDDPRWGHVLAAVIVGTTDVAVLEDACQGALPSYKMPRRWFHATQMPLTTSGKIHRRTLHAMITARDPAITDMT